MVVWIETILHGLVMSQVLVTTAWWCGLEPPLLNLVEKIQRHHHMVAQITADEHHGSDSLMKSTPNVTTQINIKITQ